MTDEEILALRDGSWPTQHARWIALADEALRRGAEMARLRVDLERIASGDDIEQDRLRERIARLEAALESASRIIANGCDGGIDWPADARRWRRDYQDLLQPAATRAEPR